MWSLVDPPRTVGCPSVAMVETDGSLVALKDPQRGVRETKGAQAVHSGIVQLRPDSATQLIRPQVNRVQLVGSDGDEAQDDRWR